MDSPGKTDNYVPPVEYLAHACPDCNGCVEIREHPNGSWIWKCTRCGLGMLRRVIASRQT